MAKKQPRRAARSTVQAAEDTVEGFAHDLGRLLGDARSKAEGWLGQRKAIAAYLSGIRDTATSLLGQLESANQPEGGRRRRRAAAATDSASVSAPAGRAGGKKRRTMSAEARARIGAAQRRRWARVKRGLK